MTCLPSDDDDLAAVMRLVGDEVGQDMADVERQITPYVSPGRRHVPARGETQAEQSLDPIAAALQCSNEWPACDATMVDPMRSGDAVLATERLDPLASCVVQVGCNHSNGPVWHSGNGEVPEPGGQMLDEGDGYPVVRSPGRNDGRSQIR